MNPYEKIKELARLRNISIRELEKQLGYSNGYFSKWKNVSPNSDGLSKVADYFNVSVDYLLGRVKTPDLKQEVDGFFRIEKDGLEGEDLAEYIDDVSAYAELRRQKLLKKREKNKWGRLNKER